MTDLAITIEDIRSAATQIEGAAVYMPLLENAALNRLAGRRVLIKFEGPSTPAPSSFAAPTTASAVSRRKTGPQGWWHGHRAITRKVSPRPRACLACPPPS
jgi:threonine dehydratase